MGERGVMMALPWNVSREDAASPRSHPNHARKKPHEKSSRSGIFDHVHDDVVCVRQARRGASVLGRDTRQCGECTSSHTHDSATAHPGTCNNLWRCRPRNQRVELPVKSARTHAVAAKKRRDHAGPGLCPCASDTARLIHGYRPLATPRAMGETGVGFTISRQVDPSWRGGLKGFYPLGIHAGILARARGKGACER